MKELPDSDGKYSRLNLLQSLQLNFVSEPIYHAHILFGHCYKQQEGWAKYLSRLVRGNGILYDIEFLTEPNGRRVAAFGYHAGYAGAAVALMAWAHRVSDPSAPLGPVRHTTFRTGA